MGLTFMILTGLRTSMFCVNLVTSSATSLRMKDVSGCEDSALGGRKAYVRRVPTGAFRWVDIVSDKCCEKKMVEALEGDCALHMLLREGDDPPSVMRGYNNSASTRFEFEKLKTSNYYNLSITNLECRNRRCCEVNMHRHTGERFNVHSSTLTTSTNTPSFRRP